MNKIFLHHFQKSGQLSVRIPDYQRILDELFLFFVRNDHVDDDVTVQTFLPMAIALAKKRGVISAKTTCIVAGVEEVAYLARKHTKLTPKALVHDGEHVEKGAKIISFEGTAEDILAYERVFVNILQRMSGIATETGKYREKIHDLRLKSPPMIAATRKTPWMHVDKKAVAVGGGLTHRLDLKDGILLKDNHLELLQQAVGLRGEAEAITYAISNSNIPTEIIVIEVEVKTDEAAVAALGVWKKHKRKNPFILLLDNFTPVKAGEIILALRKENADVFFEASGGISLENVTLFAKAGVDVISVGSLTHSSQAVDLSLDIVA